MRKRRSAVGEAPPELRGLLVALDDEDPAPGETEERVGVLEHVGIGREHDVDVHEGAVQPHRLVGEHAEERGRLPLLLRAVLRVGLHVEAEQLEQGEADALAHGDRAPPPDGVDAQGEGPLGKQIRGLHPLEREVDEGRVGLGHLPLPLVERLRVRVRAQEVDAQVELAASPPPREHLLHGGDDVPRLCIPAAEPEAGRVEVGNLVGPDHRQIGVGQVSVAGTAVLGGLRQRGPDLPQQRCVDGERLVDPLQDQDAETAAQVAADQVRREGTEHGQVQHADPEAARVAQVVADRLGVLDDRPLSDDHVLGVLDPVAGGPRVVAAAERRVLREGPIGELDDVIEVEGTLGGDALRVAVLVLHRSEDHGVVEVEQLGNPPALRAEHQALGGRRRLDHVGRIAQVLPHQVGLRQPQRLEHVTGQEPVLRADPRVERELGDPVRDQVQVRGLLDVLGEDLEEARVVDRVIVVVTAVDVEGLLGHGAAGQVEHVREPLADRGVERLVHVGDALPGREVGRAQADQAHSGGDGGRGVLPLGLEEDQPAPVDVRRAPGDGRRPALPHLRRGGDRIGPGRLRGRGLHRHDGGAPVQGLREAGVLRGGRRPGRLHGPEVARVVRPGRPPGPLAAFLSCARLCHRWVLPRPPLVADPPGRREETGRVTRLGGPRPSSAPHIVAAPEWVRGPTSPSPSDRHLAATR
jgi:hypothetical protein